MLERGTEALKRRAVAEGVPLAYEAIPPALLALAHVYGVEDLLGRHVGRRSHRHPGQGELLPGAAAIDLLAEAEVGELGHLAARQHDVGRLDVAMDDAARRGRLEGAGDLKAPAAGVAPGHLAAMLDLLLQARSLDQLHGEEELPLVEAEAAHADDVGVADLLGQLGLALEAGEELLVARRLLIEDLERHRAAVLGRRLVDRRRRTFAQLAAQPVLAEHALARLGGQG